ncbi:hypothetical protein [Pyrobaculum aerophilum]|uniref:Uncharacterized protein n=1 Tax=Pyrobaculum aerophilum TaxID=13773 RepID=A0A371R6M1_9CREN|nr:hypothetical protein [Pyrobaculum aerophilum]RFA97283.1 hypothetical protein CGL51_03515 [Pyrobaculum aerophilum]RFB00136.1 hypothetical protein CGL52_02005 [Pyrobaculum aerophilum]
MTSVERDIAAKLALLMLEELALRKNGKIKVKYWKTYRMVVFWLGKEVADGIVRKLIEGGFIKIEGKYIVLVKRFSHGKSLNAILREAYNLLSTGIRQ